MIKAIVGANWGDEGKGKVTDIIAQHADVVVRFQGGNNAGHTIINEFGKFALHMLPSGIFNEHTMNVIGNGVALNIPALLQEIESVKSKYDKPFQLMVSDRAQIVMSYHVNFDKYEEERLSKSSFGSTKSGIAPFYADKFAKIGFQVCELFDLDHCNEKIDRLLDIKNTLLTHLYHQQPLTKQQLLDELADHRDKIAPYVGDVIAYLNKAHQENKTILLEGQLGALRDPDFGIYPYSTSSSTIAPYAPVGAGLPVAIDEVWAVTKAYSSAVGAGPFVAELFDEAGDTLRAKGGDAGEYGATTGRARRVGYFDCVATRYGVSVQGATHVVLTNLDVLSYLDEIPVIIGYDTPHFHQDRFPNITRIKHSKPIYTTLPGWKCDISTIKDYNDLPKQAKDYVDFIEQQINVNIVWVSNGPHRDQLLVRK